MVQQAAHVAAPLCGGGGGDRGCSSQQAAAAWAWLEHNGATCITPSRAEGLRGAAIRRTARPASRFKKEFMASLELSRSDMGGNPGAWRPRRHSFHGESVRESAGITVQRPESTPIVASSDREQHVHVDVILGWNGDDDNDIAGAGSTLLDKFELESVWRQVRRHQVVPGASSRNAKRINSADHEFPDDASKWGGGAMRRGGSARNPRHCRSSNKDDLHQHGGSAPGFLHQLLRFGISKSASSPALCSSVATANSIRDPRRRVGAHHPSEQKHEAKLQIPDARLRSLVRLDLGDEELDDFHHHKHRHIHHHHHHHHHHLLHHNTGDASLLKHIRSTNGTPLISEKLHESFPKELLKHPHYSIERHGGRPQYGYLGKNEGKAR